MFILLPYVVFILYLGNNDVFGPSSRLYIFCLSIGDGNEYLNIGSERDPNITVFEYIVFGR